MGVELVRGQNQPLTRTRLEIRVRAAVPLPAAVIVDGTGERDPARLAWPGGPAPAGVILPAGADRPIVVDLAAVPAGTPRLTVLLALPQGQDAPTSFGRITPPPRVAVFDVGGEELARFTLHGLDDETAVAALELYRRQGAWRIRAVGQGYAAGPRRMLEEYGVPDAERAAGRLRAVGAPDRSPSAIPAQRSGPPTPAALGAEDRPDPSRPVAGDAVGWTLEERLYNQVGGMFEDLARRIAAYRGAVDFAQARLDAELDALLADPTGRTGAAHEAARERAQARRDALTDQARAALDHDLRGLAAESEVVEPALPWAMAGWESPVWHGYRVPSVADATPMAVRIGDLHLPEVPELRIPMLLPLPLDEGLWIDTGQDYGSAAAAESGVSRRRAAEMAAGLALRLLAAHPVDGLTVHLAAAGDRDTVTDAFGPLGVTGALREWGEAAGLLAAMTRRVDLVQMALRAGAPDALPPDLGPGRHLLVITGFPYGVDDRAVNQLRYLLDEGPAAGVHVMLLADRADARAFGPVLDPLWRSLLRLTPLPDDHLADPWVGHAWTYEPLLVPDGSRVLEHVAAGLAAARQAYGEGRTGR
ncbi:TerD family protein [Streptomyces sp. ICBB 8177]|uniref:TerD family protein n=1 Tax=Streptomyces sp. ICBB 8177 TaxID=563922 RepID=UPI000D68297B|nr:TerD family protein [Streptomyces sp. ICBB 8177]PWI43492.1 phosphonate metabolism protein [Streptomyces sp. ICBB 8177]